jgi:uncharacterized Rossmann fold enzyme
MRQSFVRNGITLLSGFDPAGRCEKIADAVLIKDKTLYFCPSPLFGYGLGKFLSRLENEAPNSAVLCVEADPELYELSLENMDLSVKNHAKLRITNITTAEKLCSFLGAQWGARAFRRIETLKLTGGWQLFGELYGSLCDSLRREIAVDWSNAMTLAKLGRLYIRNALRNLPLLADFPSISNLSFDFSPVLVLGAGPSLDETLSALEKHFGETFHKPENRAFKIVCVDTCLGALKDRKIIPDLVVILESQHWNLNDFTGAKGWEVQSAIDLSAYPQSSRLLAGNGFLFMTPWTSLKIFERLKERGFLSSVVPPLGSVGLSAVEISRRLTSGKIILCGLDFSFTVDKYHARSTPAHRRRLDTQNRLRTVLNAAVLDSAFAAVSKSGFPVLSSPVMRNYRDLFEQEFGGDARLFDIEGTGLPLGIKTLSMEDAIKALGEKQSGKLLNVNKVNVEWKILLKEKLSVFLENEEKRINELRDILTGTAQMDREKLKILIDECDYLWAHFPDYSGGKRPDLNDDDVLSFLNRVRAEIDPMMALLGG